jgi:hypothetical protein
MAQHIMNQLLHLRGCGSGLVRSADVITHLRSHSYSMDVWCTVKQVVHFGVDHN